MVATVPNLSLFQNPPKNYMFGKKWSAGVITVELAVPIFEVVLVSEYIGYIGGRKRDSNSGGCKHRGEKGGCTELYSTNTSSWPS